MRSKLNRRKFLAVSCALLLSVITFVISVLWNDAWLSPESVAIHLVIDNRTHKQLGPFVISDGQDSVPLHINQIEPLTAVDVYYKKSESWGENAITLTDRNGKDYSVIPYFENQQKGRVDIRIECLTPNGLSGKKRTLVSWCFSIKWEDWGTSICE